MQNLGIYVSPLMLAEEKQMQQGQSSVISRTWQCEVHEDCMDIMHCIQQSLRPTQRNVFVKFRAFTVLVERGVDQYEICIW